MSRPIVQRVRGEIMAMSVDANDFTTLVLDHLPQDDRSMSDDHVAPGERVAQVMIGLPLKTDLLGRTIEIERTVVKFDQGPTGMIDVLWAGGESQVTVYDRVRTDQLEDAYQKWDRPPLVWVHDHSRP